MKKYILEFLKRGLLAASGGPVVLAIIYGCLGAAGVVDSLTPAEVCKGVLSVTVLAFTVAGVGVVYQIERLPLLPATLIHALTLYVDYLLIYLLNSWLPRSLMGIGVFTLIFVGIYGLTWLIVLVCIRIKTQSLNLKLETRNGSEELQKTE